MRIVTAEQSREMDRIAIEERGIPSTDLMERAAAALADEVMALMKDTPGPVSYTHLDVYKRQERMYPTIWLMGL